MALPPLRSLPPAGASTTARSTAPNRACPVPPSGTVGAPDPQRRRWAPSPRAGTRTSGTRPHVRSDARPDRHRQPPRAGTHAPRRAVERLRPQAPERKRGSPAAHRDHRPEVEGRRQEERHDPRESAPGRGEGVGPARRIAGSRECRDGHRAGLDGEPVELVEAGEAGPRRNSPTPLGIGARTAVSGGDQLQTIRLTAGDERGGCACPVIRTGKSLRPPSHGAQSPEPGALWALGLPGRPRPVHRSGAAGTPDGRRPDPSPACGALRFRPRATAGPGLRPVSSAAAGQHRPARACPSCTPSASDTHPPGRAPTRPGPGGTVRASAGRRSA